MGYVLAAIAGAFLAGAAQIILELIKRRADQRGISAAIAGEISGILFAAEHSGMELHFKTLVRMLRAGTAPSPPWVLVDPAVKPTPVLDAYMDRIGALGSNLAERVARFYTLRGQVTLAIKILASGIYNDKPALAIAHIEQGLDVWAECKAIGIELLPDLRSLSGES